MRVATLSNHENSTRAEAIVPPLPLPCRGATTSLCPNATVTQHPRPRDAHDDSRPPTTRTMNQQNNHLPPVPTARMQCSTSQAHFITITVADVAVRIGGSCSSHHAFLLGGAGASTAAINASAAAVVAKLVVVAALVVPLTGDVGNFEWQA